MMQSLKRHRSKKESLADLLNYAAVVEDGIIVNKNGSLMAGWIYQGADHASSIDAERDQISILLSKTLSPLGSGWMIHVDAVRKTASNYSTRSDSHFPDRISAALDEERRRQFERLGALYEGYFVLVVTWFPPQNAQRKLMELMFDDDKTIPDTKSRTQKLLAQFSQEVTSIESRLSLAVKLKRLQGERVVTEEGTSITYDTFLSWLQFCITGLSHPLQLPRNPMYLDALIGGQELWGGTVPKIGRHFIQVVAIEGFPLEGTSGMLTALGELACEYRWSSRFIFMDEHEAVNHYEKFRKKWRQKVRGFFDQVFHTNSGPVDQDALSMMVDAESAISDIKSGLVAAGYYTGVVVLMDEDREHLEAASRHIEKAINRLGFVARIETINTLDAYLGSLPGHGVENVRRPLMHTLNLAHLLPISTIWTGSEKAPCPFYPPHSPALMHCVTQGATPFRLNLHVHDVGHTLILGPTGAGKSTHLAFIAAQLLRYQGMAIFVFDKGLSMYPLTKAVGGLHFSVAADDDRLAFCPLQFLETRSDRSFAMQWIETLLALNGVSVTPEQRNLIGTAIGSMANSGSKTLSDFSNTVQEDVIRETLKPYTIAGSMGHLLDAESDGLALSQFTTFEIEELMNLGTKFALPVLLYLFRRIERSLTGQPAAIILDEAWLMLGHTTFREKIREWLKVLRKANCIVIMATQSLTDARNSGILDVLVESTATKIFLPNINARDPDMSALYQRMGLNVRQIELLAQAVPKKDYYIVSTKGHRLYELALGKLALAFVSVSDRESIREIKKLEAKFGARWVDEWLAARQIQLADYVPEQENLMQERAAVEGAEVIA